MWRVQDTTAELQLATCTGQVDLQRPSLQLTRFGATHWTDTKPSLLAVQQCVVDENVRLQDAYVRGTDLIATYTLPDQVVAQLYFRAIDDDTSSSCAVELIASLNCNDGVRQPGFLIRSLAGQTPVQTTAQSAIWGITDDLAYVEMSHPRNGDSVESNDFHHRLFFDELEKGVIRRAHLRGLLLPLSCDDAATHLKTWQAEFAASDLPLTT